MALIEVYVLFGFFLGRLIFREEQFTDAGALLFLGVFRLSLYVLLAVTLPTFQQVFLLILAGTLLIAMDILWVRTNIGVAYLLLLLLVMVVVPSILRAIVAEIPATPNPISAGLSDMSEHVVLLSAIRSQGDYIRLLFVATGFAFILRESTLIIRTVLERISAEPTDEYDEPDEEEYNRGRLIGHLERLLVYFLLIFGYYLGVMFVIGVKSIARYKELQNRNFAEYFLIGTLLSIILAMAAALYVKLQFMLVV